RLTPSPLKLGARGESEAPSLKLDRRPDETAGPAARPRYRVLEQSPRRDHNPGRLRAAALDLAQQIGAGAVGQVDVEQHRRWPLGDKRRQRRRSRLGFNRLVTPAAQRLSKHPPNRRLVVYD